MADGQQGTQYVFRPCILADIKEVAEGLPNIEGVGGTEYSRLIGELVGQYCANTGELRRLLMTQMRLKWGRAEAGFSRRVEAGFPSKDIRFDWDNAARYGLQVVVLQQRMRQMCSLNGLDKDLQLQIKTR